VDIVCYCLRLFTDPILILFVLMTAGLWILRDLRRHHHKKLGWWFLLSSLLFLYLLSISPVILCLAYALEKECLLQRYDKTKSVDVIVVLGGGLSSRGLQTGLGPSEETSLRLISGLQMFKRLNAKSIVLSGGGSSVISEAEVMARIAKDLGVEESRIIVEPRSQNTWEHAIELSKLVKNKDATIGISTSALHMKRSLKVFNKYFPNTIPLPSSFLYSKRRLSVESFIPNTYRFYQTNTIIHEIMGMLWYYIKDNMNGVEVAK
jgi:uncharacterized SAM-binding protein YcdF (DUF218 family)